MSKISSKYETIFIINPTLDEEARKALIDRFITLITEQAEIGEIDEWGMRRLAYEIDDQRDGYYVLVNFTATPEFPAELDRIYKITDGIMRSLIICKDN